MIQTRKIFVSLNSRTVGNSLRRSLSSHTDTSVEHKPQKLQPNKHYDIIIAGGGLVGTALACSLEKNKIFADKTVLLLEGSPKFKGFEAGQYGNRVSALNNGTMKLMQSIDCWETITSTRYKPVKQMKVWDACSDASIEFSHDHFSNEVAYIVENDLVLHSLYQQLNNSKNIDIKNLSKIVNVRLPKDGYPHSVVELKEGDVFSCELLVSNKL